MRSQRRHRDRLSYNRIPQGTVLWVVIRVEISVVSIQDRDFVVLIDANGERATKAFAVARGEGRHRCCTATAADFAHIRSGANLADEEEISGVIKRDGVRHDWWIGERNRRAWRCRAFRKEAHEGVDRTAAIGACDRNGHDALA